MTMLTTLALPRKPARPQETRVAPRPHVRMEGYAVPLRRTRPVPAETEVGPELARRVRGGHTYDWMRNDEYSYDAAEARSGLVGHEG
jgi:hypothetical protein